jgi:hypothetical protein
MKSSDPDPEREALRREAVVFLERAVNRFAGHIPTRFRFAGNRKYEHR